MKYYGCKLILRIIKIWNSCVVMSCLLYFDYTQKWHHHLKGKATFEAHFHVLPKASYNWLWYPLAINYNYLSPLLFNYYTHFTLRRFCDAKFLLKQTVQNKQFLWSNPSYTTVPSHCFSKGAIIGYCRMDFKYAIIFNVFVPKTGL